MTGSKGEGIRWVDFDDFLNKIIVLGLTQNSPALLCASLNELSCLAVQLVLSSSGRLAGSILRKSYVFLNTLAQRARATAF